MFPFVSVYINALFATFIGLRFLKFWMNERLNLFANNCQVIEHSAYIVDGTSKKAKLY